MLVDATSTVTIILAILVRQRLSLFVTFQRRRDEVQNRGYGRRLCGSFHEGIKPEIWGTKGGSLTATDHPTGRRQETGAILQGRIQG